MRKKFNMVVPLLFGVILVGVGSFIIGCTIGLKEQKEQQAAHICKEPNPYNESLYFSQQNTGGK